jgi:diaminopropionate ammonia-lyase
MLENKSKIPESEALFKPNAERAMAFARCCPIYTPTALVRLVDDGKPVLIKNESTRFGLGSFKALGGIYAVAQLLSDTVEAQTGIRPEMTELLSDSVRKVADTQTYVCASAGNHGMAVATGAQLFGAHARIYVSTEVPGSFATRLRERGAEACVAGANYEESLMAANNDVKETGAHLLSDGSWEGYLKPPSLVMEGYTVMACELRDSFATSGEWPSDVYLQAGVGGMAAAITHMIRRDWLVQPRIVIVEPTAAECLALSATKGELVEAKGPISNMGRLDCKAASLLAFDTLIRCDVEYQSVTDEEAQAAVVALGKSDLHSTPSGVAGYAAWQRDNAAGTTAGKIPLLVVSEQAL